MTDHRSIVNPPKKQMSSVASCQIERLASLLAQFRQESLIPATPEIYCSVLLTTTSFNKSKIWGSQLFHAVGCYWPPIMHPCRALSHVECRSNILYSTNILYHDVPCNWWLWYATHMELTRQCILGTSNEKKKKKKKNRLQCFRGCAALPIRLLIYKWGSMALQGIWRMKEVEYTRRSFHWLVCS